MSWTIGGPPRGRPAPSKAPTRSGHASGMRTVRVAICAPAWVSAIRRPPASLVYSTRAPMKPFLASSDLPNSVTRAYRPSKRPGAAVRSAVT